MKKLAVLNKKQAKGEKNDFQLIKLLICNDPNSFLFKSTEICPVALSPDDWLAVVYVIMYLISDRLQVLPSGVVWVQDEEADLPAGFTPGHAQNSMCQDAPSW